jgi:hypothetical protein
LKNEAFAGIHASEPVVEDHVPEVLPTVGTNSYMPSR